MNNFKRLCEITAAEIEMSKVTNPNLARLLDQAISRRGQYVFWSSKPKGHKDHNESDCHHKDYTESNWGGRSYSHTDEMESDAHSVHTDHTDHNDHSEDSHVDNQYSEGQYHTDSSGGHEDTHKSSHTDSDP